MKIFIHTNEVQMLGAKVAAYSFRKALKGAKDISVEVLSNDMFPELKEFHGQKFSHRGQRLNFDYDDIQSFTLLRLSIPEIMKYTSSAVVVDPDVFWVSNASPRKLFEYVNQKTPIACVFDGHWRSSVMITQNSMLRDWNLQNAISKLKDGVDYKDLIELKNVDQAMINPLPSIYNCFDSLPDDGAILHFTRRQTQPWRTGLPLRAKFGEHLVKRGLRIITKRNKHIPHPNSKLESIFFELAREAYHLGEITTSEIEQAQNNKLVRADFLTKVR